MATAERTAEVTWQGELGSGGGSFVVGSGAMPEQGITWASRTEEPAGKTSPEELIAAAHAGCYAMALANTLAEAGNPSERLSVSANVAFDVDSLRVSTSDLTVEASVPGLDDAAFQEAARQAEQACPVSNALRGNVDIRLNASLA